MALSDLKSNGARRPGPIKSFNRHRNIPKWLVAARLGSWDAPTPPGAEGSFLRPCRRKLRRDIAGQLEVLSSRFQLRVADHGTVRSWITRDFRLGESGVNSCYRKPIRQRSEAQYAYAPYRLRLQRNPCHPA